MRRDLVGSVVLLVVVALLVLRPWEELGAGSRGPARFSARVIRAVDGDTLEVAMPDGGREDVRLIGVDTPETVKPGTPVQCFGPRASDFTHRVADGRSARLELGVERRDVYGRLLAYVRISGRFLNAMLVGRGLARTLTIAPNDRLAPLFARLQIRAARAGRGLWGACPP
jgi:micrococcal nuclease